MQEENFRSWLSNIRRLDSTTVNCRVANCHRVERYEGALDEHFDQDRCRRLIQRLSYSTDDEIHNTRPRHRIPIDGNVRNGTATLKAAVTLYRQFREVWPNGAGLPRRTPDHAATGHSIAIRNELREIVDRLRLVDMAPIDLLRTFAAVIDELKRRGIARSINNPLADYTEWLVSTKLGLNLAANSRSGFDALSSDGMRYQIKGRRVGAENKSIQLSALRNLDEHNFDFLVGVVFEPELSIRQAAIVPYDVVVERSAYNAHTNSHIFHMTPSLLGDPRVRDVRGKLMA